MNGLDFIGLLILDAFWSGLVSLGFVVLFNTSFRTLPGCILGGVVGYAACTALVQSGMDIELATLVGATVIGFLGMIFAYYWKAPMPIFTVSAAVTLVPSMFALSAIMALMEVSLGFPETVSAALTYAKINAIKTARILCAIALGIAVPTLIFYVTGLGRKKNAIQL